MMYISKATSNLFKYGLLVPKRIDLELDVTQGTANRRTFMPSSGIGTVCSEAPSQGRHAFTHADGTYLTRGRLSHRLKSAIPSANLDTHSFHIGAASAAAMAGIPDSTIQVMGRWSDNAYRTYADAKTNFQTGCSVDEP